MYSQASPNFRFLEYEDINDKSVLCWKLTKNKYNKKTKKTNTDSNIHRFHAGRAHHNEIILFEYLQLCQILDEAALADWCDVQRRRPLIMIGLDRVVKLVYGALRRHWAGR